MDGVLARLPERPHLCRRPHGHAQQTFENTQTGQASAWQNPDSGNFGSITPTRTYETDGRYCREYQQEITVGGELEKSYGTACRQPDGTWKIDG